MSKKPFKETNATAKICSESQKDLREEMKFTAILSVLTNVLI